MDKFVKKVLSTISFDWTRIALGFFVCLIAVFGALSNAPVDDWLIYVSKFINWCVSFLVGSILAYAVYFILFLYGISLIFSTKKLAKVNLNLTILGAVFIVFGCLILVSNSMVDQELGYLTFSNFEGYFQHLYNDFPNVQNYSNTGVIGMFLVALINSGMTNIGSNVIGSILLVIGSFFAFGKPCIKATRLIIDYKNQVFRKDVKDNVPGYDVAKDVNYTYQNVNNIKEETAQKRTIMINQTEIKPEIEPAIENMMNSHVEVSEPPVEPVKEPIKENVYRASPMNNNVNQTSGLIKAHFDLDETNKPQVNTKSTSGENINQAYQNNNQTAAQVASESVITPMPEVQPTINYGNKVTEEVLNKTEAINQYAYAQKEREEVVTPIVEQTKQPTLNELAHKNQPTPQPASSHMSQDEIDRLAAKKPEFEEPETTYSNKVELKNEKQYVGEYKYPPIDLLESRDSSDTLDENKRVCDSRKEKINQIFADLNIGASIIDYTIGPSVTRFDLQTEKNVSINGISRYIDDISVRLGGVDCRFVPIVQGKSTSGIEIANAKVSLVNFKDCVDRLPKGDKYGLYIPFGQDISGNYISADLKEFPHLLVCGTTGSGKSIFMHSVIMSLIMRNAVDDLKIVMIDPKRVEFGKYKEMPHLLCPPINDSHKAYIALQKLCDEMDHRYEIFENCGVSNIKQYNQDALENGKDKMPYIVLICDEFADLMDTNRKCSEPVVRLGQKARASGIHMIIATQRPSTNVITGTIKANLPVRVALSCSSYTDSMTILGEGGAEKLLGNGDMLVSCPLISKQGFVRVQGSFVDNKEIRKTVEFLKEHYPVKYNPDFLDLEEKTKSTASLESIAQQKEENYNSMYDKIKNWVMSQEYTSISKIQRTFGLGFPRAGKMFSMLEEEGIVESEATATNNSKGRRVLVHAPEEPFVQSENPGSIEQTTMDYSK